MIDDTNTIDAAEAFEAQLAEETMEAEIATGRLIDPAEAFEAQLAEETMEAEFIIARLIFEDEEKEGNDNAR